MDIIAVKDTFDIIDNNTINFLQDALNCSTNENKKLLVFVELNSDFFTQDERMETLKNIKLIDNIILLKNDNVIEELKNNNITILVSNNEGDIIFSNICIVKILSNQSSSIMNIKQAPIVKNILIDKNTAQNLYDLMFIINMIFKKLNIEYFAIGGTLLGAVRNQGLIPWDTDLDIAIFKKDIIKFSGMEFRTYLKHFGIRLRKASTCYFLKRKTASIDIFPFCEIKPKVYGFLFPKARKIWSKRIFKHNDLYPLKKYKFGPINVMGAHNVKPFFDGCGFGDYLNVGIIGLSCHKEKHHNLIKLLKKNKLNVVKSKKILHKKYDCQIDPNLFMPHYEKYNNVF